MAEVDPTTASGVVNGLSPEELRSVSHSRSSIFSMFPAANDQSGMSTVKSGASASSTYHIYGSETLVMWGNADADLVRGKIKGPWQPVLNEQGKALMSLWAIDYRKTTVNPYKEFIIEFMVTHASQGTLVVDSAYKRLQKYDDREAFPYIYKLWLDETLPIDFGRELLGCDKYLDKEMKLDFTKTKGCEVDFAFHHVEGEEGRAPGLLCKGKLNLADHMGLPGLVGAYGLMRTLSMAAGAQNSWHLVSPPGVIEQENMAAGTEKHTAQNSNPVWDMYYETSPKFSDAAPGDDLEFGGEIKELGFVAELYQHDPDFKAVLLAPWHYELLDSTGPVPEKPATTQQAKATGEWWRLGRR